MTAGKIGAKPRVRTVLTNRQRKFVELVMGGASNAEAYRRAYNKPNILIQDASDQGHRASVRPAVKAELARLRGLSDRKKLLSLNDRLEILADIAQDAAALKSDRTRAIDVYSKISGDLAPERHEIAGPGGGSILVTAAVATRTMGRRERVEAIKAARAAARAREAAP